MDAEHQRREAIRDILLGEKPVGDGVSNQWPHLTGRRTSRANANRFFAGAILDFQIPAETAWENGERLVDHIAPDPETVWEWIASQAEDEWAAEASNSTHDRGRAQGQRHALRERRHQAGLPCVQNCGQVGFW